ARGRALRGSATTSRYARSARISRASRGSRFMGRAPSSLGRRDRTSLYPTGTSRERCIGGMNDSGNDPERAAAQVEKLRGLRERRRRLALLRRVTSRRSRDAVEPDGFRRVPIRLVNTLPAARAVELDPVLVVAGEVLVPAGERE